MTGGVLDMGFWATVLLVVSGACSFLVARWLRKRITGKRQERERIAREAAQSRQVRRARERKKRG